jgi:cysteine desulfurase/selenocysteine lyase
MRYLDNATNSWPKSRSVHEAMDRVFNGQHEGSAEIIGAQAQELLTSVLGLPDLSTIHFTSSHREALNLALSLIPWQAGDEIAISTVEQQSLLDLVLGLARTKGVRFFVIPATQQSPFDLEACEALLRDNPRIRLLAVPHASAITGCILPVPEIAKLSRRYSCPLLIDISQTTVLIPMRGETVQADLLVCSANLALGGPRQLAALCMLPDRSIALQQQSPALGLGLSLDPSALRTEDLARLAGWTAGLREMDAMARTAKRHPGWKYAEKLRNGLMEIPEVTVYHFSEQTQRLPLVSFNVLNHHPETLACRLWQEEGLWLQAGLQQSRLSHESLDTIQRGGTLRASLGYHTRQEDINALLAALKRIIFTPPHRAEKNFFY